MKREDTPEPKQHGHFCPPAFEHEYRAQYDLKDQRQIRRRSQFAVMQVRKTHGEPETESLVVGPPADWEAQLEAVTAKSQARRDAMRVLEEQTP